MLKLTPIILILAYAVALWFFSVWRLKRELAERSTALDHSALNPLLDRLGAAMDLPRIQARIYEIPAINGLATVDGRVYVTRGFIDGMEQGRFTPAEVSSVIAHELGHVAHGHARRRMIDFAGQNVIRGVLIGTVGRFVPFIGPWLIGLMTTAIAARLSRQDEYEADRFATALMLRAGLGAGAQISMFEKLGRLGGARGPAATWLMSHPAPDQRITAIRDNLSRWQGGAGPKNASGGDI
ncbi:MAG: M48 family metallopeptidase [Paracoccus sp. (in: a-proteobacteria)]|nr:M48 family metallopeptidase [Paracoccus sp. (in: a-proteobacteria)]